MAEIEEIHDLDPVVFHEQVHSFEFWFEAVQGYLEGLEHGHRPETRDVAFEDAERAVDFTKEEKLSTNLYNIHAEITGIHSSSGLSGQGTVKIYEAQVLSYSYLLEGVSAP